MSIEASMPRKVEGWNRASGHRNRSLPMVMTVGHLVGLLQGGGGKESRGHLLLKIKRDVAELLLHFPNNLPLGDGCEGVATYIEHLHEKSH
jgi:hypothetical protein